MSTKNGLVLLRSSYTSAGFKKAINLMSPNSFSMGVLQQKQQQQHRPRFYSSETKQNTTATEQQLEISENEKRLSTELEKLTNDIVILNKKNEELLDKYKRSLADSENLRKRLTKQIDDAKIFGIQSFCKDLLEVADTLGHATQSVPQDQIGENNPHLKNLFEGLNMTKNALLQVFKRHGLEEINPMNEKFDPNFHEALFQKESKDVEPNQVVQVTKLGYKLHQRCLRPALVGVSR